jgi:polyphosphate kinase
MNRDDAREHVTLRHPALESPGTLPARGGEPAPEPPPPDGAAVADDGRVATSVTEEELGRYLNRELQWLAFNERVLHQAFDERVPLLERVRFLSIVSSNLDEFFMKRVGGLRRQLAAGVMGDGPGPGEMLNKIRETVLPLVKLTAKRFRRELTPALAEAGIDLVEYESLTDRERRDTQRWYHDNVFPLLTPLAVDRGHRFPFISNLSVSLGVMLRRPDDPDRLFARVKIPEVVEQWHQLGDSMRFVSLLDVVKHNLHDLFPGMEIRNVIAFRVTRNADAEEDNEDADDLLSQIQQQLRHRRFAPVVRLQIGKNESRRLLEFLSEAMELEPRDIYETRGLLDGGSLEEIADLPLPEHRFPVWTPVTPSRLRRTERDIFATIRQNDMLVHHPYESFDDSVEEFVRQAAADPHVLGIKQALYRTSGDSPFIPELIRAAEAGKQVAVLVELRARFDEARNIHWAQKLENAGVHVAHGVVGLKTHTKITLVVRREHDILRCYAHIGTGNYHSRTARLYEDVGLLTCDPAMTGDVVNLFNYITGRSTQEEYAKLLVAPHSMKTRFLELIEREIEHHGAGRPARIVAKMNQLQDREVIEALYAASGAGVPIDLLVRGFCTLRPEVPGMSDNIRVMSIIGRFLEHSRIFYFANGHEDPLDGDFFIGSADWMFRNLHARVEAACPIESRPLKGRLWSILSITLGDHRTGWDMHPDGTHHRRSPEGLDPDSAEALGAHRALMEMTTAEVIGD